MKNINSELIIIIILVLSIALGVIKKFVPDFPLKEVFGLWAIIVPAFFGQRLGAGYIKRRYNNVRD